MKYTFLFLALSGCAMMGHQEPMAACEGKPHGMIERGYVSTTTHKGMPCVPVSRTCVNGVWSGPVTYPTCAEGAQ